MSLSELWFSACFKEAETVKGHALTDSEKQEIMATNPPPRMIDFRMQ